MLRRYHLVNQLTTVNKEEKEKKHYVLLNDIEHLNYAEVDDFKIYYYNIFTCIKYYNNV
jgi:hypothetical protein